MNTAIRYGGWIQTFTGRQFWPLDPRKEEVEIEDIAHALSLLCRFAGHVPVMYSVAEHSVRVSWQLAGLDPLVQLRGLLHDASEAYLLDIPSPIKPYLSGYKAHEDTLMRVICRRFYLPEDEPQEVKTADLKLLATEMRDLRSPVVKPWSNLDGIKPLTSRIKPWTSEQAEQMFLERFADLTGSGAW